MATGNGSNPARIQPPVAVVGMACRLPGAANPDEFWDLLCEQQSAIGTPSAVRLRANPRISGLTGGFLESVDTFDADFFGISPREATALDPQQRLLLELVWESIERTGTPPDELRGQEIGVYVGVTASDYALLGAELGEDAIDRFTLTGSNRGILANRISYTFGFTGPSLAVDTAQSSGLAAVHAAASAIRAGELTTAFAAAVGLNLTRDGAVAAERFGGLSQSGRASVFDADADGYVRGEGAVVLVLKSLDQAKSDDDQVLAVLASSALNNDGATTSLTVPDAAAQARVVTRAIEASGVSPDDIQYVELHGTGTKVGDPIEASGLGDAIGRARSADDPLLVGSVKPNVGHLEGAAGIVGLLKVVLAVHHRKLPATLGHRRINPAIDSDALNLRVVTATQEWPHPDRTLRAGVSSFGVGGTNAHVVVEESPLGVSGSGVGVSGVVPFVVSARSRGGLLGQVSRLRDAIVDSGVGLGSVASSLVRDRVVFADRAVILAESAPQLVAGLDDVAASRPSSSVVVGSGASGSGGVVGVVFAGQGSQRVGAGRELYLSEPVFAAAFDEIVALVDAELGAAVEFSIADVIWGASGTEGLIDSTAFTQPVLFAVEVSLFRLLQSRGVTVDVVLGHSVGAIAAVHVAGALSLEDAVRLVVARARLMGELPTGGAMVAVGADEQDVVSVIAEFGGGGVSLAAVNGIASVVVSGVEADVVRVADVLKSRGRRVKRLTVSHAFHSVLMEPMLEQFGEIVAGLEFRDPVLTVVSDSLGEVVSGKVLADPQYWVSHVRGTVRFADAVHAARDAGVDFVVEIAPSPALVGAIAETDGVGVVSLLGNNTRTHPDTGTGEVVSILRAVANVFVSGHDVHWESVVPEAVSVPLPTYAFDRSRYWLNGTASANAEHPVPEDPAPRTENSLDVDELVHAATATVLGYARDAKVDTGRTFESLGLDSLGATELVTILSRSIGRSVSPGIVYDFPTPALLTAHLDGSERRSDPVPSSFAESRPGDRADPVVIVAVSGRFPGDNDSPEHLWDFVSAGGDAVGNFPNDRGWHLDRLYDPEGLRSGSTYTRHGGFLSGAGDFDAEFFGISPREAASMDPQQRLVLQSTWELFERAGIDPATLAGTRTGVFIGATPQEYGPRLHESTGSAEGFTLTGAAPSVVSGRVAYTFGLEGPAISVDTACSSSLVALHLAVQSIRSGESTSAIAGGVTVMANPGMFTEFSRQRGLSPDGRCKAFSADADGTGWSEAVSLLLVERLSDAQRLGHPVLAVVRGTAVNSDGASNGLTAPNGPSQQRVIRAALADAGLSPGDIDVVEAHGTGTKVGDPIEANALIAVYGEGRSAENPLWLGSLKSNIGHTQAAAGAAGITKIVQSFAHDELPPTLHADRPSSFVDWSDGTIRLAQTTTPWPRTTKPRRAGISSFGISGTNAHVVVEESPSGSGPGGVDSGVGVSGVVPFVVSARTRGALVGQVSRLRDAIVDSGVGLGSLASSLVRDRVVFSERAVVLAGSESELVAGLDDVAASRPSSSVAVGSGIQGSGGVVGVVFAGQGSQRVGAGRELYLSEPVFAAAFDEIVALVDTELGAAVEFSIADVIWGASGTEGLIDSTAFTQPVLFAVEVALFRLLQSRGVTVDVVLGHSVGAIAAVHVAGALSLEDAVRLVVARARLMGELPTGGSMVAVGADEKDVLSVIAEFGGGGVSLAAVNGIASVVVSGVEADVVRVADVLKSQGRRVKRLTVSHAFHSVLMEPMLEQFGEIVAGLTFRDPVLTVVSDSLGEVTSGKVLADPQYWVSHVRGTVRFADAVRAARDAGVDFVVEIAPSPALAGAIAETDGVGAVSLLSNNTRTHPDTGTGEVVSILRAVANVFVSGHDVHWPNVIPEAAPVPLPTYAFQNERYWLESTSAFDGPKNETDTFWDLVGTGDADAISEHLGIDDDRVRTALDEVLPALSSWSSRRDTDATLNSWRYRFDWSRLPLPPSSARYGTTILVAAPGERAHAWAESIEQAASAAGGTVVRVDGGAAPTELLAALRETVGGESVTVISLLGLQESPVGEHTELPETLVRHAQVIAALTGIDADIRFWALTTGAVSVHTTEQVSSAVGEWISSYTAIAVAEAAVAAGGAIDVPEVPSDPAIDAMIAAVASGGGEPIVAVRGRDVFARGLKSAPFAPDVTARQWVPRGTVLITGGTGSLGAQVARRLAANGARDLLLISARGEANPRAAALVAELAELGARATVRAVDVADRAALSAVLAEIPASSPLTDVIHTAAVLDDALIADLDVERIAAVHRVKVGGAENLHALTEGLDLDTFVLFSSVTAVLGAAGYGNYAPGNAYLDALAERRRNTGLAATSIAWGLWAGDGIAGADATAALRRSGVAPMNVEIALTGLERAVSAGDPRTVIADVDWISHIDSDSASESVTALPGFSFPETVRALPVSERRSFVFNRIRGEIARVLGHDRDDSVDDDRGLRDQGINSLASVELRRGLEIITGLHLSSTVIFDHPSPAALTDLVLELVVPDARSAVDELLEEIDRVAESVSVLDLSETDRRTVIERFREHSTRLPDASGDGGNGSTSRDLADVSDDELVDFIGSEFGIS